MGIEWALAIKAVAEMITEAMKGQSDAVRKQMWEWYVEDVKAWRAFFAPKP